MKSFLLHALVGSSFALAASLAPLFAQDKGEAKPAAARSAPNGAGTKTGEEKLLAAGEVELLAGVAGKQLEAKFIPKNDREARLLIKNLTDRPLTVRLPDSLAARPVLAQFGFGAARPNKRPASATPQAVGVGMPGMNPMNRGAGNVNPLNGNRVFFNIPSERLLELRVDTVCLEHGKKEPRPQIAYQLCPLDEVTASPGVAGILDRLGAGSLDQRASQAAVWHLACGMSWEDLAAKRIEHLNAPSELYFTGEQLRSAEDAATKAQEPAGDSEKGPSSDSGKSVAASSSNELR